MSNGMISGQTEVPGGIICMWSGQVNNIPSGWALCDGQNGTPDLRDRFILGAGGKYDAGATGGEEKHNLTVSEMPSHNHIFSGTTTSAGIHAHTGKLGAIESNAVTVKSAFGPRATLKMYGFYYNENTGRNEVLGFSSLTSSGATLNIPANSATLTINQNGAHTHTVNGTIDNTGSGTAFNNMPPYYALCFIMKLQNLPTTRGGQCSSVQLTYKYALSYNEVNKYYRRCIY